MWLFRHFKVIRSLKGFCPALRLFISIVFSPSFVILLLLKSFQGEFEVTHTQRTFEAAYMPAKDNLAGVCIYTPRCWGMSQSVRKRRLSSQTNNKRAETEGRKFYVAYKLTRMYWNFLVPSLGRSHPCQQLSLNIHFPRPPHAIHLDWLIWLFLLKKIYTHVVDVDATKIRIVGTGQHVDP